MWSENETVNTPHRNVKDPSTKMISVTFSYAEPKWIMVLKWLYRMFKVSHIGVNKLYFIFKSGLVE